ncbi:MAG: alpha-galactosidase [Prevotellaceae bacterium]|nr:alpha-galactosidase [Prevotellaceae bacterium]
MKRILSIFVTLAATFSLACAQTTKAPIMGWSSWNTYRVNINDSLIIRQADALVSTGLKDAGYRFINIDDGFFGFRDASGKMHSHPQRFPNGLKHIAEHIHSLGLMAGIYSDAGNHTCGSQYDNDANGYFAGLYGHEEQDAKLYFKEWGFDFIKIDYCGAGNDLCLDEKQRYIDIRNAFDRAGCQNVLMNICRWTFPGTWAAGIACSWRISPDIRPRWSSVKSIVEKNLYLSSYCRKGHYNDMDMLEIGRGMTPNEEEVHFGLWCIMSSPLMIGCDLTKIPEPSLKLLKNPELIALNQDTLGLQAYVVQHKGDGYVLVKDFRKLRGTARAVALYNPSDTVCRFSVPLSALEYTGKVKLRDVIARKDMKSVTDSIVMELPARSVKILLADGKRIEPSLYEAEWAYLPCFDALGKREKQILYAPNSDASGGVVVSWLGGRKENIMQWNNVYSTLGGDYNMLISYVPAMRRNLEVTVNGVTTRLNQLETTGTIATVTIPVTLKQGYNKVEMGSPYSWAVDVDKFELVPRGK